MTSSAAKDEGLLDGYTVIDFTRVLAGPYCTRLLADLGARVIKIERPGEGDEIRYTTLQLDADRTDQSSYFARLNTGKEGIAINLSRPEAREIVLDLVRTADVLAGTHAFGAICAALLRRARTGKGATLDISMLECLIAADDITYGSLLNGGRVERQPRVGMMVHAIGERHIALQTAGAPHLWSRLVALVGKPELAADPRFSTPQARRENWGALQQVYRDWLGRYQTADEAIAALSAARVPVVPMLSPEEVVDHPQLASREAFPQVPHAGCGSIRVTATPFFVDGKPTHPHGSAPYRIGEHTHDVLADVLDYPRARIEALRKLGVIEMPD